MAVKLIIVLMVLAIVLSVAVGASFWYLKERAEMNHEKEMTEKEMEREREQELWDE